MEKSILILFIVLNAFLVNAQRQYSSQNVEIQWGPVQARVWRTTHGKFIAYDATGHYTYRKTKKTDWIGKYDAEMKKEKEIALIFPSSSLKITVINFFHINNELWLIKTETNKKSKENSIYIQQIDKETLRPTTKEILVGTITGDYYKKMYNGQVDFVVSNDESKLLITYKLPVSRGSLRQNKVHVYDTKTMQEIWERVVEFDTDEHHLSLDGKYVSNTGELFFLSNEFRSRNDMEIDEVQQNKYHLLMYNKDENHDFELKFEDKFITDIKIGLKDDGNVIGSGFYSDKGTRSLKGSFFITIDTKGNKIGQKSFKEFGVDFIKANLTDKQERKVDRNIEKGKDVELYEYNLNYLIQKDDGGAILIAEQYYVETRSYYSPSCKCYQTTYIYHYNDIIVVSVDSSGNIEWNSKVPKQQRMQNNSTPLGYYAGWTKDKIFFVFNDSPKNFDNSVNRESGDYYAYNGGKSVVTLATVNIEREGYYEFEPLWYSQDVAGMVYPRYNAQQLADDVIMLFILGNKRTQRYVKLKLK